VPKVTRNVDGLRRGARIHSLLYAVHLARNPLRTYDVTWQGLVYHRCNARGTRGFVAFSKAGAMGLFYDPDAKAAKLEALLTGVPEALRAYARREKLFDVLDSVTAAIWSDATGALASSVPWRKALAAGAHLVEHETENPDKAIASLAESYGLSPEQASAAKRVFGRKVTIVPSGARVVVGSAERGPLTLIMNQATRELLAGAGIELG
jgi:hypothetical protein